MIHFANILNMQEKEGGDNFLSFLPYLISLITK